MEKPRLLLREKQINGKRQNKLHLLPMKSDCICPMRRSYLLIRPSADPLSISWSVTHKHVTLSLASSIVYKIIYLFIMLKTVAFNNFIVQTKHI